MSRWETIELGKAIESDLAADLEKQGAYVSPHVLRVRVRADGRGVEYELADGADAADVRAKIERYSVAMVSKFRKLPRKVLHTTERRDKGPLYHGVYAELLRRGWVTELGRGQVALSGPALNIVRAVDS